MLSLPRIKTKLFCEWTIVVLVFALPQAFCDETTSKPGSSYATEDFDIDGLSNKNEALVGSLPDDEDTDGDGLFDGAEAVPLNTIMRVPAAPDVNYALIDLGEDVYAAGVNDRGDVLLLGEGSGEALESAQFWRNGSFISIGEGVRGTFRGPLADGSVYFATPEVEDTVSDAYGTGTRTISMDKRWHPSSPGSTVSVGPYSESTTWPGISQSEFVPVPPTLSIIGPKNRSGYEGGWSAMVAAIPGSLPPGFTFDSDSIHPASSSASVTRINDYHDRFLTFRGSAGAGYKKSGEVPAYLSAGGVIALSGWQSNPDSYSTATGYWAVNGSQGPNVQQSKTIKFANAELVTVATGYDGKYFLRFSGPFAEILGATQITDINSQITPEGPYFFGRKENNTPALWCVNSGNFESLSLRDVSDLPQDQAGVVSRKISKNLVIPLGSEIWRNSRTLSLADLCKSNIFNSLYANQISPNGSFLIGSATKHTTEANHAGLLLPFEFKEPYPASGFDGESDPNWLMIPQDGENYVDAHTPANENTEIKFKVLPEPGGAAVYPDSTNESPKTITVTNPHLGEDTAVEIGLGTAFGTGGLKLAVKKYQEQAVVIHAVTQVYTTPMPLQPGEGKPNQVCVQGGSILWSTPGGDDQIEPGLKITTGANGVCETAADSNDQQLIPVGQGIHKDIPPGNVPTAQELKQYLDRVFGIQSNVYFTVSRNDVSVDYDIDIKNKIMDISPLAGFLTPEQDVVVGNRDTSVFNVYYVNDFKTKAITGHPSIHSAVGVSSEFLKIAFIRDAAQNELHVTAHEIGHIFGLKHSDQTNLANGSPNPTYLERTDPKKRLMFSAEQSEAPILLLKPEWDVTNNNQ